MAMHPKGRLVFMNCCEDSDHSADQILSRSKSSKLLSFLSDNKRDHIEIVTSEYQMSERVCMFYRRIFAEAGYSNFNFLHLTKYCITDQQVVERLSSAQVVFFVGNHSGLYTILKGSQILRILHRKYMQENFTIGGVSLGALCIPGIMIDEKTGGGSHPKKGLELTPGLGFLNNCIIDTQYDQKTGYDKLAYTVVEHHDFLGIGMGSDTALIIQKGFLGSCKGDGTIMLINALDTKHLKEGIHSPNQSFYVKNLKGRVLIDGCTVNLMNGGNAHVL